MKSLSAGSRRDVDGAGQADGKECEAVIPVALHSASPLFCILVFSPLWLFFIPDSLKTRYFAYLYFFQLVARLPV